MKETTAISELAALLLALPERVSFSGSRYPKPAERANTMTNVKFAKQQQQKKLCSIHHVWIC